MVKHELVKVLFGAIFVLSIKEGTKYLFNLILPNLMFTAAIRYKRKNKHQIWFILDDYLPANVVFELLVEKGGECICVFVGCGG